MERITLKDVANACGVSITSVSLVLNDKPNNLSEETKRLIKDTASKLNYYPNTIARAMVTEKTGLITLLVPNINNPFFSEFVEAINREAQIYGYNVILCETNNDFEKTLELLNVFTSSFVDGILFCKSLEMSDEEESQLINKIIERGIPLVSFDTSIDNVVTQGVSVDHYYGGYIATKYLVESGHKRIGCYTGSKKIKTSNLRLEGYKDALIENNIPINYDYIVEGNYAIDNSNKIALEVALKNKLTALFCLNDMMAVGVIKECRKVNLNLPSDLSIIGFDDTFVTELVYPTLTTIHQPINLIVTKTLEMLNKSIESKKNMRKVIKLKPKLIIRDSVSVIS